MEEVRGKVFAAFSRKLRGEANISLLIVVLISSANYHILQVANIKIFNL